MEALEIEDICSDRLVLPDTDQNCWPGRAELEVVTFPPAYELTQAIEILVGADHYWRILSGEARKLEGPLVAVKTDFGWILQCPIPQITPWYPAPLRQSWNRHQAPRTNFEPSEN